MKAQVNDAKLDEYVKLDSIINDKRPCALVEENDGYIYLAVHTGIDSIHLLYVRANSPVSNPGDLTPCQIDQMDLTHRLFRPCDPELSIQISN